MPSAWQDGMTRDLFGLEAAPASRLAVRGKVRAKLTKGISGLTGIGSSASADLQTSLESKLVKLLPMDGWMKSSMIWKVAITPLRQRYFRLALSKRLMKESGFSLWHTPRSVMIEETPENFVRRMGDRNGTCCPNLAVQVLYPTLAARDYRSSMSLETVKRRQLESTRGVNLSEFVQRLEQNNGKLNPQWVGWLMGYPPEWEQSRPMAMPSSRKSPPSLSKQQCDNTTKGSNQLTGGKE